MNEKILALGQKCLRLVKSDKRTSSFLGAKPMVGGPFDWPRKNDKALGFIGQLDLKEINPCKEIDWLPSNGRLLFFYDFEQWPWGFDPKDIGGWATVYENGDSDLFSPELPLDLAIEHLLPSIKYLKSESFVSYPDGQSLDFESLGMTGDDGEAYYNFIDENFGDEPRHQIGGFPSPVQEDSMEEECQLASGGIYCGDSEGYNSKQAKNLLGELLDWKLLLQFDSDDEIEAMWGDMGMLYFWVRESDANNCDFSKPWLILQCS
ncbi:YwqG family protein [Glaciecola siphonariae]|uniref:YwqG family protein n=1 Tax=Glaciecola siphonariae TaxID=521012 RepID=A0ABV9LYW4_9ALTE